MKELVIDGFAGGGGASTGIAMAIGRSPDIAINHDEAAPRELFCAQGFSDGYEIETGVRDDGTSMPLTKTEQIRMCGNSVCPQVAEALVKANYVETETKAREPAPLDFALVAAE